MKRWHVFVLAVFVLVNGWLMWIRSTRPPMHLPEAASERERDMERQALLLDWNSTNMQGLSGLSLREWVRSKSDDTCFPDDSERPSMKADSLSSERQDDLAVAVSEFVAATAKNDVEATIQYMHARGKRLSPTVMTRYREASASDAKTNALLQSKDDLEFLKAYYQHYQLGNSHWSGISIDASCFRLWECSLRQVAHLLKGEDLAASMFAIFQSQRTWTHSFEASETDDAEAAIQHEGKLLVADVRLLIEHDANGGTYRSPYLLRFWYNTEAMRWQPVLLCRINSSADFPEAGPVF